MELNMLNGVSKEAIKLAKKHFVECQSFTEDGFDFDTKWQKENFKSALSKPYSRILVGSPNMLSSEILFINTYKILDENKFNCFLLSDFFLKRAKSDELVEKCREYDYIFVNGLGINQDILSAVRRLLQMKKIGVVLSYLYYYRNYNKITTLSSHNPVIYDREYLCWGNFDSVIYQTSTTRYGENKNA